MTYRVIQWATGFVGQEAILGVLAHPELELVGAWVHSPDKVGRDVGEICGIDPIGVQRRRHPRRDLRDRRRRRRVRAGAREHPRRDPAARVGQERRDAGRAGSIPTTTRRACTRSRPRARKAGVTLHGTGINPGGITERFPLTLSALCRDIRHVRAEEFSDIRNYPTEMVVREIMLFGKDPESGADEPDARGARPRVQAVDRHDRGRARLRARRREARDARDGRRDARRSTRRSACIEAGTVAAQRFTWEGDGRRRARHHRARQLADGRSRPRSAVDARRAALRGRVRRRPAARGDVPRAAPAGDRRAPGDRAHRPGDALRERDPVRRRGRARASRPTSTCRSSPDAPVIARRARTAARRGR